MSKTIRLERWWPSRVLGIAALIVPLGNNRYWEWTLVFAGLALVSFLIECRGFRRPVRWLHLGIWGCAWLLLAGTTFPSFRGSDRTAAPLALTR